MELVLSIVLVLLMAAAVFFMLCFFAIVAIEVAPDIVDIFIYKQPKSNALYLLTADIFDSMIIALISSMFFYLAYFFANTITIERDYVRLITIGGAMIGSFVFGFFSSKIHKRIKR